MRILKETPLTFAQAAKLVPGRSGRGVGVSTIWRWSLTGCRGVKLESVMVGGSRMTSEEAIERFLTAINGPTVTVSRDDRRAAIAKAQAALANI